MIPLTILTRRSMLGEFGSTGPTSAKAANPAKVTRLPFFLYADESGLGAEDCHVKVAAPKKNKPKRKQEQEPEIPVDPSIFLLSPHAHEFVPSAVSSDAAMNVDATEFVPECFYGQYFCPPTTVFNAEAFMDSDKDSDEEDVSTAAGESGDSEGESSAQLVPPPGLAPPPGLDAPWGALVPPPGLA